MKTAIVGYTGFVGSNLCLSHCFDAKYNSKNIGEAFGTSPELLVYSGVRAEMFLANKYPEQDASIIHGAIDNIKKIVPRNVVLISTIGVYDNTLDGDEDTSIDKEKVLPYGRNRLALEEWVSANYPDSLIVRLPAIYGEGLKKNFVYDMIHFIPSMLKPDKWAELLCGTGYEDCYELEENGFYKCTATDACRLRGLKAHFTSVGFSALNFTDSRSVYQFYNLNNLWADIQVALDNGIRLLTIATEPVSAAEIYEMVYGCDFTNEFNPNYPVQCLRSKYAHLFGGQNGWFSTKDEVMRDLERFIKQHQA